MCACLCTTKMSYSMQKMSPPLGPSLRSSSSITSSTCTSSRMSVCACGSVQWECVCGSMYVGVCSGSVYVGVCMWECACGSVCGSVQFECMSEHVGVDVWDVGIQSLQLCLIIFRHISCSMYGGMKYGISSWTIPYLLSAKSPVSRPEKFMSGPLF